MFPKHAKLRPNKNAFAFISLCSSLQLGIYFYNIQNNNESLSPPNLPYDSALEAHSQGGHHSSFPGIFEYGPNSNALIVTGASIISEYDSPQTIWFQFFALGERIFGDPWGQYGGFVDMTNKTHGKLKKWDEMANEPFYCNIGSRSGRRNKMMMIPNHGLDSNTNELVQVWRCLLHNGTHAQDSILSSSDVQRFLTNPSDLVLPIDVVYEHGLNFTKIARVDIPLFDPHVGLTKQILKDTKTPFPEERFNISLCLHARYSGLLYLNEFIKYHHGILGIEHFHLGLDTEINGVEDDSVLQMAKTLLEPDINDGRVSVSLLWDEKSSGIRATTRETTKAIFYQNCLYRAKSSSEFVATWDLDEYFLFTDEGARERRQNLYEFLRGISHPECEDWSFVSMRSCTAGGGGDSGLVGLDFQLRENATNEVWQKSISRTKNVFLNSFHIPGSTLPMGKSNQIADLTALMPTDGNCAFYTEDAIMIHVQGIHWRGSARTLEGAVPNELVHLLRGETCVQVVSVTVFFTSEIATISWLHSPPNYFLSSRNNARHPTPN